MKTPVVFLVFNRPDVTFKVFERIRVAQPSTLFVIADGPRDGREGDIDLCMQVRAIIDKGVDWPCNVLKSYADINLGCGPCVSQGLEWVFSQVDEAIILEDDCLPDTSFFEYCEVILGKYRYDNSIGAICGTNFLSEQLFSDDIYFSNYFCPWGWASWKRAWKKYEYNLPKYFDQKSLNIIKNHTSSYRAYKYWKRAFSHVANNKHTWDFQFIYSLWKSGLIVVLPSTNLITNIGFSENATHTGNFKSPLANLKSKSFIFPLRIPRNCEIIIQNETAIEAIAYPDPKLWHLFLAKIPKRVKTPAKKLFKYIIGKRLFTE